MAEFLTRDIKVLLGKAREGSYNAAHILGADFIKGVMLGRVFGIPTLDTIDDANKTGTGFEFATQLRTNYWQHFAMTIADELNVGLGALLFARALGGNHAAPSQLGGAASEVWEHTLLMQTAAQGRQLPSFNIITSVGRVDATNYGAEFQYPGCVIESLTVSQTRSEPPQISADIVGSGKFVAPIAADIASANIPLYTVISDYIHGAAVTIAFNDGTAINLSQEGRVRGWSFTLNNNLRRDDRRPGDPFRVADDPATGAFVNRLTRGPRSATFSTTVSLAENFPVREFLTHSQNKIITSLLVTCKGNRMAVPGTLPAGSDNCVFEIQLPKSHLRALTATDENDEAALTLDFFPVKGSGEYLQGRIVNDRDTALL